MAVLQTPPGLPGGVSTRVLSPASASALSGLAWPAKDLLDVLPSSIDLTRALADLGTTIAASPAVTTSDGALSASLTSGAAALVTVLVGGGSAGGAPASVGILVPLADGGELDIVVRQPVVDRRGAAGFAAGSTTVAGLMLETGQPLLADDGTALTL